MVEEICRNIYRIGVKLPGNPLKELNSYFIRGKENDLLIDTGFRRDACREYLEEGLEELGSDPERRNVLLTHLHADHSGMADLFAGKNRTIFMSDKDLAYLKQQLSGMIRYIRHRRFISEGFPEEELQEMYRTNPAMTECLKETDSRFYGLKNAAVLNVGDYYLETIQVPGHTPGNCMFYLQEQQIMFTGDHILFDITPNITYWPEIPDSLGNYIENLKRVRNIPVRLALPGHRKTGVYKDRIDALLKHHVSRLDEAAVVVRDNPGMNAYEIAGKMTWKIKASGWDTFPVVQKWFAVGECMSHLDYHLKRGTIQYTDENGKCRYYMNQTPKV